MGSTGGNLLVTVLALSIAILTVWFNVLEPRRRSSHAALSVRWEKLYRTRASSAGLSGQRFQEERYERIIITNHGPAVAHSVAVVASAAEAWPSPENSLGSVTFEADVLPFVRMQPGQQLHLPIQSIGCDRGMKVELQWSDGRRGQQVTMFVLAPHVVF